MTFNLKEASSWEPLIRRVLVHHLGKQYAELVASIRSDNDEYTFKEIISKISKSISPTELLGNIKASMCDHFESVVTYHGCRTDDVSSYYKNGIKTLSGNSTQELFRKEFSDHFSNEDIEVAIKSVPLRIREGRVFISLDDRGYTESCGHYLIYGSEYLNCLAIHLPNATEETRDLLKLKGRATVLVCKVPFSEIDNFDYLIGHLIEDHFDRIIDPQKDVYYIDYTIIRQELVSPSEVIDHYHPTKIKDVFKSNEIWNDSLMTYISPTRS